MTQKLTPREIGTRWFSEVWNNKNSNAIAELLAPEAKGHLEGGQEIVGGDQFVAFQKSILEALPDIHLEIINTLADGDDACVLWLATATHTGHGFGLVPTGKPVSFRGMTWFHVVDGKITEGWDAWNYNGLFAAMGAPSGSVP